MGSGGGEKKGERREDAGQKMKKVKELTEEIKMEADCFVFSWRGSAAVLAIKHEGDYRAGEFA